MKKRRATEPLAVPQGPARKAASGKGHKARHKAERLGNAGADAATAAAPATAAAAAAASAQPAEAAAKRPRSVQVDAAAAGAKHKRQKVAAAPAAPAPAADGGVPAAASAEAAPAAKRSRKMQKIGTAGTDSKRRGPAAAGPGAALAPAERSAAGAAAESRAAKKQRRAAAKGAGAGSDSLGGPSGGEEPALGVAAEAAAEQRVAKRKEKKDRRRADEADADIGRLGGVPADPERRAAWLARVAEMAAARGPNDKPLPRPMRLALKAQARAERAAAARAPLAARAKPSRQEWEARRAEAAAVSGAPPAAQLAWLARNQAAAAGAGGPRIADLAGARRRSRSKAQACRADKVMVRLPAGPSLEARLRAAVPELLPALAGRGGPGAKGEAAPSGSPAALLVSPSAVYAQELRRQLRGLSPDRPVFKAFAKHLKLEAQRALLAAERFGMAAGTPARLAQLAALGALRMDGLRLLVVDVRANDKQQSLMDIADVRRDFFRLWAHVGPAVAAGRARVALVSSAAGARGAPGAAATQRAAGLATDGLTDEE